MNDEQRLELAEKMVNLTDDQRLDFLNDLKEIPSAEDLASIQILTDDLKASATDPVCEAPQEEDPAPVIA